MFFYFSPQKQNRSHPKAQRAAQQRVPTGAALSCLLLCMALLPACHENARLSGPQRRYLHDNWSFRQMGRDDWAPANVPGNVHDDLMRQNRLPDPFFRANEDSVQWVEKADWEYRCTFVVSEKQMAQAGQALVFEGLDTYAEVFLNEQAVAQTDNMFRTWRLPVRGILRPGENQLRIVFRSPLAAADSAWRALGYELPGSIRVMTRKAAFHYGWDWGPRLVTSGVWRPVYLETWDEARIARWHVQQHTPAPDTAYLTAHAEVESFAPDARVTLKLWQDAFFDGEKWTENPPLLLGETDATLQTGKNQVSVNGNIAAPKRWWCQGLGPSNLYRLRLEVAKGGGRLLDDSSKAIGLRQVEVVHEADAQGKSFYFKLNGVPVFAKGANYIPQHSLQSRVAHAHYDALLADAVAANMNMLRVWGGGIYEDDYFYQRCDQLGLLVWQDFMFACAMYPGDTAFLENVRQEATDNVRRLRDHPCIALWCGNNENAEAWHHWGWQQPFNEAQKRRIWDDYQALHYAVLKPVVDAHSGGLRFWESSPLYGRAEGRSLAHGDSHYWGVWHDGEPFETYAQKIPRFMSEFGFQSFPDWRTIEAFTDSSDRELLSPVMMVHQKHPRGNPLIKKYMDLYYHPAKDFPAFAYLSQMLQAEGICFGIEAHRRARPYCMGSLYWQLNDCWPVASWSGRDFYGRWKALHYRLREAFAPVLLSPVLAGDTLRVVGLNDTLSERPGVLDVAVLDFLGKTFFSEKKDVVLTPASAANLWEKPLAALGLAKKDRQKVFVRFRLTAPNGQLLSERLFFLDKAKNLALPAPIYRIEQAPATDGSYRVTVRAETLVRGLALYAAVPGRWSNNYLDLAPGQTVTLAFTPDMPAAALAPPTATSLNEAWEAKAKAWWWPF